jgi:hypothetical protein
MNVDIYMANSLVLSYSDYVLVLPLALSSPSVYMIGQELSTLLLPRYSILVVQFSNLIDIPQGSYVTKNTELQGRIEVIFGAVGEWDSSLGTNLKDGDEITCKAVYGAIPMAGKRVMCNIMLGDGVTKSPKVIMRNFA